MSQKIEAGKYISMYGPTVGDKVRLGDTDLFIEVEKDYTVYGDECKFGGGKVLEMVWVNQLQELVKMEI